MKLAQRIRLKERQAEQARLALQDNTAEFRRVLHAKLASRTAMALGFGGGWLLGLSIQRRYRKPKPAVAPAATASQRQGLPRHWLRSYFVWPFLLATARDYLVSHRPSRKEA